MKTKSIFLTALFIYILNSCDNADLLYNGKAIVLLAGDFQGELFKEQKAVIAYKDDRDSIHVETLILPEFTRPTFPGDSIEILVHPDKIDFGPLYKQPYSVKKRFVYKLKNEIGTRTILFDNGVLTMGTFDASGNILSLEFYTYKSNDFIEIYPIGFFGTRAFEFKGNLGESTISVIGHEDVYHFEPLLN